MRPVPLSFALVTLGLFASGCTSTSSTPALVEPVHTATVRIESDVRGGGVKVNGSLASMLPGEVYLVVDPDGKAVRNYDIALSTNILSGTNAGGTANANHGGVTIEVGEPVPARIYFGTGGPQITGTALVNRPPQR